MIKNKRYAVSFEVLTYRNGDLHSNKQEFTTMTGEVNKQTLASHAWHLIKEGTKEVFEPACGSAIDGEYVTLERKLGNILNINELPEPTGEMNYDHAYADCEKYNYN